MTTVLVVDDHPVFRSGVAALLGANGYEIVGEAAGAAEAIELVRRLRPAIVLMDLGLPDGSGVTATERIVAEHPDVRVVVVTMFDDDGSVRAALRAGAAGYVVKDAGHAEIVAAVRAAELGAVVLGSGVARSTPSTVTFVEPAADPFGLTRREGQVLNLVVRGLTNRQIAERLGLSGKTISNILSVILAKMGVHDRVEAAALARGLPGVQGRDTGADG
jgi:DNA-binding NarL/FixJ family response regulator